MLLRDKMAFSMDADQVGSGSDSRVVASPASKNEAMDSDNEISLSLMPAARKTDMVRPGRISHLRP